MQIRGANTLFADIFELPAVEKQRKGRSESLNAQRNELLIDRYYFIVQTTGFRYDIIIRILSREFFLSVVTIPEIIDGNIDKLRAVRKAAPSRKELEKKWPHINWCAPVIPLED